MAATKANVVVHDNVTLEAAAADTVSGTQNWGTGYGGMVTIKVTNGATGPTVPAQVQLWVSGDGTNFYQFGGPLVSRTGNSVVTSWAVELPIGVMQWRTVSGSNTAQDVTLRVESQQVTAL